MTEKTLWGGITKVDSKQRIVGGYYTDEKVDMVGDRILKEATIAALPEWKEWGNIREQHGMPIGTAVKIGEPEWNYLEAKIVDDDAWKKVEGGVYKGFSVGIIVDDMEPVNSSDLPDELFQDNPVEWRKKFPVINELRKIQLIECSITDRPANPRAKFVMMKKAGTQITKDTSTPTAGQVVVCSNCKKEFDYLSLEESGMGYVKCPQCNWLVDQEGTATESKGTTEPTKEKQVDEEKQGVAPETPPEPVVESEPKANEPEVKKEEGDPGEMDAMKEMLDMMRQMMDVIKQVLDEVRNAPKPTDEELAHKPEAEKAVEPEAKKEEPVTEVKTEAVEVAKANSEGDLVKAITEVMDKSFGDFLAKAEEKDQALKKEILEYIEKLRNQAQPTQAALITEEPKVEEKPQPATPDSVRKDMRSVIQARFEQDK